MNFSRQDFSLENTGLIVFQFWPNISRERTRELTL